MGKASTSLASHVGKTWQDASIPSPKVIREKLDFEILWRGKNPISVAKQFGKETCRLCSQERMEILKAKRYDKKNFINTCDKIYGRCRHKPLFHRYIKQNEISADEANKAEKVVMRERGQTKWLNWKKKKKISPVKKENFLSHTHTTSNASRLSGV